MNAISCRDLYVALSALTPIRATTTQAGLPPRPEKSGTLLKSEVLSLDRVPVTMIANGGKRWEMFQGVLATGESIAVHESEQPAGVAANPPHTIHHSELILVQEGTLRFEYDGESAKIDAGGVILVAPGTRHAAKNVSDGPAKYLVIAIGGDTT
jgi:mannose-6-phosphate isomerase-like protein (cupin superfamily)